MKFSEKLTKLRKENNLSQEALADKLDVSRQSVSKWESGQTYPEMDKLLTLCKIFNVTLDDLTNDSINYSDVNKKSKNTINSFIDDITYIMNKSVTMFKNIKGRERFKIIFELFVIFMILLALRLPFEYLINLTDNIFYAYPSLGFITTIWEFLINILYLAFFIFSYLYIYKTNYLDKFELKESIKEDSNKEETIIREEPKSYVYKETNTSPVFKILGKILMLTLKFFLVLISLPFLFSFIFLAIYLFIMLYLLFKGILYFGFTIVGIGGLILNGFIILLVSTFLFNHKISFKKMFIMFISGLLLTGIGIGLCVTEVIDTKYVDKEPKTNLEYVNKSYEYDMSDNLLIGSYGNHIIEDYYFNRTDVKFVVDNSLSDKIVVDTTYYSEFSTLNINEYSLSNYNFIDFSNRINPSNKIINIVLDNLKDKEIYNYNNLYTAYIVVRGNEENINKLKDNSSKYYQELNQINRDEELSGCYNALDDLNNNESILNDTISKYEEEIEDLKDKNAELEDKLNDYKSKVKDLIEE